MEGRLRIDVDLRLQLAKAAPAGSPERPVDDSRGVIPKPRCFAPTRSAMAQMTSWLERHSPGGSMSGPELDAGGRRPDRCRRAP